MGWRNQTSHQQESKEVKAALLKAGIPVRSVGHGKGTAWGWLEITLEYPSMEHERCEPPLGHLCRSGCPACEKWRQLRSQAITVARQVTSREGEYDGEILVK